MAETGERSRTPLVAPRVEFDLSALGLGILGYLVYHAGWLGLAAALGVSAPGESLLGSSRALRDEFFGGLLSLLDRLPYLDQFLALLGADTGAGGALGLPWWQHLVVGAWLLVFWSVVGGALARVYAMRIARDESLPWDAALGFSLRDLRAFIQAPLFIAGAALFFLAMEGLAGAAAGIPFAGPGLQAVLHPLVFLAGLIVLVITVGGVFGLPVLHAALATERNGTLDAVSRTYSYLFTRPLLYVTGGAIVLVFSGVLHALGIWFLEATNATLALGAEWSPETARSIDAGFAAAADLSRPPTGDDLRPATVWVSWAWSVAGFLTVRGFVLSYVVGGFTDLYFLMRKTVDGTADTEVYVDGEGEPDLGDPLAGEPAEPAAAPHDSSPPEAPAAPAGDA
jgi:hypothetical protein